MSANHNTPEGVTVSHHSSCQIHLKGLVMDVNDTKFSIGGLTLDLSDLNYSSFPCVLPMVRVGDYMEASVHYEWDALIGGQHRLASIDAYFCLPKRSVAANPVTTTPVAAENPQTILASHCGGDENKAELEHNSASGKNPENVKNVTVSTAPAATQSPVRTASAATTSAVTDPATQSAAKAAPTPSVAQSQGNASSRVSTSARTSSPRASATAPAAAAAPQQPTHQAQAAPASHAERPSAGSQSRTSPRAGTATTPRASATTNKPAATATRPAFNANAATPELNY